MHPTTPKPPKPTKTLDGEATETSSTTPKPMGATPPRPHSVADGFKTPSAPISGQSVPSSTDSAVSSGSSLARVETVKKDSRFGIGYFELESGALDFVAKKYSASPHAVTNCLTSIAVTSSEEATVSTLDLSPVLTKNIDNYRQTLLSKINPIIKDSEFAAIFSDLGSNLNSCLEVYNKVAADLELIIKDIKSGAILDTFTESISLKAILLQLILSESTTLLGTVNALFLETREKIASAEKDFSNRIKTAKDDSVSALSDTLEKLKAVKEILDSDHDLGSTLVSPPRIHTSKPKSADGGEFFSHRIDATGSIIKILFVVENSNRPNVVIPIDPTAAILEYKPTQTQGDHVTAYALLTQLLMNSVPLFGRYEDLPNKIYQMLSLAFASEGKPSRDSELFQDHFTSLSKDAIVSDSVRRKFLEDNKAYGKIEDLRRFLKVYQAQQSCDQVCKIGDAYLKLANAHPNAAVAKEDGGDESGRKEDSKLKDLESITHHFLLKNLINLIDEDLARSQPKEGNPITKEIEERRLVLTTLRESIESQKKIYKDSDVRLFEDTDNLCKRVAEHMASLIDIPSHEKLKSSSGIATISYADFLRQSIARHFRICGTALACILNEIQNNSDKFNDRLATIVQHFFSTLQANKDTSAIATELEKIKSYRVFDDQLTGELKPDSNSIIFHKFLREILSDRAAEFKKLYLTYDRTPAFDSPLKPIEESFASPASGIKLVSRNPSEDLNLFNFVGDTNLTHQNLMALLATVFDDDNYYYLGNEGKNVSTAVIGSEDLDSSLRDAIISFIGQEKENDRASIALCRGHKNSLGTIEGDTHWSALHLRKITNLDGTTSIQAYHIDSLGNGTVPTSVARVLSSFATDGVGDFAAGDTRDRAQERLAQTTFLPCKTLSCTRQTDNYSCGYHTALNMLLAYNHDGDFDSYPVAPQDVISTFIQECKTQLKLQFNTTISGGGASLESKPDTVKAVFSLISGEEGPLEKLTQLLSIVESIKSKALASEEDNFGIVALLSMMQVEKLYKKLIADCTEIIRYLSLSTAEAVDQEKLEDYLNLLSAPSLCQDPEPLIPVLTKIIENISTFLKALEEDNLADYALPTPKSPKKSMETSPRPKLTGSKKENYTIFVLGRGIKNDAGIVKADEKWLDKPDKLFEFTTAKAHGEILGKIRKNAQENSPSDKTLHIIAYCHGAAGRRIILGKESYPESFFEAPSDKPSDKPLGDYKKYVLSLISCSAGDESETTASNLKDSELMVIYAGKRPTISSANNTRVRRIIDSERFIPTLISFGTDGSIYLAPPETIKILKKDEVEAFSPFAAFKEGKSPSKLEILRSIIRQQIDMIKLLNLEEDKELKSLFSLDLDELLDRNPTILDRYLQDLAFLVVITKKDDKLKYLEHLISLGVDPDQPHETEEEKLLMMTEACAAGNIAMVHFLSSTPTSARLTRASDSGFTPLMAACSRRGNEDVINFLLLNLTEADIAQKTSTEPQKSALILACQNGYDLSIVGQIIERCEIDLTKEIGTDGNNILHHAAQGGNLDVFLFLRSSLVDFRSFISKNIYEETPFDIAAKEGNLAILNFAAHKEFEFDSKPLTKNSLMQASEGGYESLVDYLVKNDVGFEGKVTPSILHILAKGDDPEGKKTQLAKKLLLAGRCSAAINKPDSSKKTPIVIAQESGNTEMVALFTIFKPPVEEVVERRGRASRAPTSATKPAAASSTEAVATAAAATTVTTPDSAPQSSGVTPMSKPLAGRDLDG